MRKRLNKAAKIGALNLLANRKGKINTTLVWKSWKTYLYQSLRDRRDT